MLPPNEKSQEAALLAKTASSTIVDVPSINIAPPGPRSREIYARVSKAMRGHSSQVALFPVVFESGRGVTLTDVDGNTYLDFSSGIYVTNCGHCHPHIVAAIQEQTARLMNCHDFATPVKDEFLQAFLRILPQGMTGVQLYSDGTVAVEAALRAARAITGKHEFLSFWKDFHGKTLGAVSLAGMTPEKGQRASGSYLAPRPYCYRCPFGQAPDRCSLFCVDFLERMIEEQTSGQVAAILLEPIQGWAGSVFPPDGFLPRLRELCDRRKILLIVDEVLTGMGRTGKWFAVDHYGVIPDLLVVGKGLGNGYPVSAIAVRDEYADAMDRISASSSYGGNPVACAAGLASIQVIENEGLLENAQRVEAAAMPRLEQLKERYPIVGDVRGKGCLFGIELVRDRETKEPHTEAGKFVYQEAFRRGLAWIPAGHILRMSPPLIMTVEQARIGMDIVEEAIARASHCVRADTGEGRHETAEPTQTEVAA